MTIQSLQNDINYYKGDLAETDRRIVEFQRQGTDDFKTNFEYRHLVNQRGLLQSQVNRAEAELAKLEPETEATDGD